LKKVLYVLQPHLQYALCFLFLAFAFALCLFVHSFIDNYVSCHVFLVSGIRQLLFRTTEMKTVRKEVNRQKQETERAHCRWTLRFNSWPIGVKSV